LCRIIKAEQSNQQSSFERYGFPEIPVSNRSDNDPGAGREKSFRRTDLGQPESHPPSWLREPEERAAATEETTEKTRALEEQAFFEGFTEGEKVGIASEKKKIDPVLNNFNQALVELEKIKKEVYAKAEQETVTLALAVARKVVCHEVHTNKEVILSIIKEALKKVVDAEKIRIRINRSDLQFLKEKKTPFANFDESRTITFEEDETILTGGCVIETNFGEVDARVEKQLQVVEEVFKSALQEQRQRN